VRGSDLLGQLAGGGTVADISADSDREWKPAPHDLLNENGLGNYLDEPTKTTFM
jgi:hypothetical protein